MDDWMITYMKRGESPSTHPPTHSIHQTKQQNNTQVLVNVRNNHKLLGRVKAFDRHCNLYVTNPPTHPPSIHPPTRFTHPLTHPPTHLPPQTTQAVGKRKGDVDRSAQERKREESEAGTSLPTHPPTHPLNPSSQ